MLIVIHTQTVGLFGRKFKDQNRYIKLFCTLDLDTISGKA